MQKLLKSVLKLNEEYTPPRVQEFLDKADQLIIDLHDVNGKLDSLVNDAEDYQKAAKKFLTSGFNKRKPNAEFVAQLTQDVNARDFAGLGSMGSSISQTNTVERYLTDVVHRLKDAIKKNDMVAVTRIFNEADQVKLLQRASGAINWGNGALNKTRPIVDLQIKKLESAAGTPIKTFKTTYDTPYDGKPRDLSSIQDGPIDGKTRYRSSMGEITIDSERTLRQMKFHEKTEQMRSLFASGLQKTKAFASTGKGKLAIGGTVAAGGAAVGLALYNNKLKETSRVAFQKIDMAIQDHMMANREARKKLAFIKASQTNIMDSKKALFMKTIDDCNAYTTINETMLNNMRQMCQESLAVVGGFGATGVFAAFYTSVSPVVIERHKALLNIRTMANTAAGDVNVSKETADVINSLLMAEQKETAAMQAIFRQFSVECDTITSDIQKTTGADYNSLTPPPTPTPDPANPVVDSPALDLPQETPDTVKQNIMQNFWQSLSQSSATTKVMYGLAGAGILYGAYKLGQKLKQKWDERKQQKEKEMQEKEARANRDLEM